MCSSDLWDPTNTQIPELAMPLIKAIEAASNGTIKINASGPETVPPFMELLDRIPELIPRAQPIARTLAAGA